MPSTRRRQPAAVIDRLLEEPYRFDFFQAIRLLETWFDRENPHSGTGALWKHLSFRNSLSLAFAASEIAGIRTVVRSPAHGEPARETARQPSDIERIEITPAFIGLLGAGGALPIFYTELFAQWEHRHRDSAARAFMDVFLHRAVVLFYEAWRHHRMPLQLESERRNRFLPLTLSIAGLGPAALRDRLGASLGGVSDYTLAYFAAALQQRPPSASTIRHLLSTYFNVAVRLDQFVGRWMALPASSQTRLGFTGAGLGHGAIASERVWQRDMRVRLTLGPMDRRKLQRFLPGAPGALALRELLTLLTGLSLEYEVRLSLRQLDVQAARLAAADAPRLGWDGFLVTRASEIDRNDAGYDIHAVA